MPEHTANQEVIQGVHEWRYNIDQRNDISFLRSMLVNCKKRYEYLQEKFGYDCINLHQPLSALGVMRSPASKQVKKVYTCHSLSFEEYRSRNPRPINVIKTLSSYFNIQARKCIEKKVLSGSDRIVVLSRFTQERLMRVYKISSEKMIIIPGGVDLQKFHPAVDNRKIRQRLNIPQEKTVLFTVRDMEPRMGLENLLYAFKEIIRELPDSYLVIGGHGPLKNRLISLSRRLGVERAVRFVGFIPEDDLPDFYRMADIFVLPTLELEGFGLITLEALASGVPVLGTPVGGTIEILSRLDPRYLFKDAKPESMASLLIDTCKQFRNNGRLWRDVSARCRAFVETRYSWERNVDATEELFEKKELG